MSTRAMARAYSQGINPYLYTGPGGDDAPLFSRLFGKDNITGGLTTGPDGKMTVTPFQGSNGFLGGWSRRQAAGLNAPIIQAMMQQQMAEAIQKMVNQNALDVEEKRNQGNLDTEKQRGKNVTDADTNRQIGAILTKYGLPDSPENRAWANSQLSKSNQEIALNRNKLENGALLDPGMQRAATRGMESEYLAPAAKNIALTTREVGPNSAAFGMPLYTGEQPSIFMGPQVSQKIEGELTDPKTGTKFGGKPVTTVTPPFAKIPVNPNVLASVTNGQNAPLDTGYQEPDFINGQGSQAGGMISNDSPPASPSPSPTGQPFFNRQGVVPQIMKGFGQYGMDIWDLYKRYIGSPVYNNLIGQ